MYIYNIYNSLESYHCHSITRVVVLYHLILLACIILITYCQLIATQGKNQDQDFCFSPLMNNLIWTPTNTGLMLQPLTNQVLILIMFIEIYM